MSVQGPTRLQQTPARAQPHRNGGAVCVICCLSGRHSAKWRRKKRERTSPSAGMLITQSIACSVFRALQVRAAVRVPEQHAGVDDQRRGRGDRGRVRGDLPGVRVQPADAAADAGPGVGGLGGVRRRGAGVDAGAARPGPEAHVRPRRHRLLHLHVRLAALHHEAGGEDQERGVHAVPAVAGRVPVRHVLVRLRPAGPGPLRRDSQRVRELSGRRAAGLVRHLPRQQQRRQSERRRRQAAGRRRRGDGLRCQEQQEGRRRRRRQGGPPGLAWS